MTKRRGVTEKTRQQKLQRLQKLFVHMLPTLHVIIIRKEMKGEREGSEHEQDNLHGQDVDIGEDMLPEQEERNIEKERRENEKKEMERRDKERREKERREKREERREKREREKREREKEKERRERDRREKDKEQEENEMMKARVKKKFRVLHLANKMLDASTKQPSTNLPLTTSTSSPSDNDNYRLIDEEMKCLFLRTRNPPDHAFDKITQKIFGHDAYQSVAKSINERYRKSFSDYRYQLKNVLSTLVKEFRQIVESGYTESSDPTDEEVNNFISREVVLKRILSRYVSAIDFTKLSETSLDKLIEFSRKCFKIVWVETESANIKEKVKKLDVITEDLEIPSRSGRNIASSLKLHLFS
ncbi:protein split ends isoform X4 [Rhizophagus clarus]|uniref:Protein split ends isoform X4 n=1 Tax=Rhizophagus clarus TaxID=94130 RepID=A0A8H3M8I6_9GLOM|nr:protein split ends isoform X4 [Rhizophagus clarus]